MSLVSAEIAGESGIPRIEPIPPGTTRPLWSVMIPTFNCAKYLRQTLESVLAQDPGSDKMQIEVVDDCSTKDDPESVVQELGRNRILFYRKRSNEGATRNFNTCISRSQGHIVHILHGDDYVDRDFYLKFGLAFDNSPACAAVFSRAFVVDEQSELIGMTPYVDSLRQVSDDPRELMIVNPLRTPAVAVKRCFYEQHGGFDNTLVHVADWEMWVRIVVRGAARMLNKPLAFHRTFSASDTSKLARKADHLRDCLRLSEKWHTQNLEGFDHAAFDWMIIRWGFSEGQRFRALGDHDAAAANFKFWRDHCTLRQRGRVYLEQLLRALIS